MEMEFALGTAWLLVPRQSTGDGGHGRAATGLIHPPGTIVKRLDHLPTGKWLVEVRMPDESLVGGAWYDVLEVDEKDIAVDAKGG